MALHLKSTGVDFTDFGDAGGMTSELLNDYEEGTWTPSIITGTISITAPSFPSDTRCSYTKVGRLVMINAYLTLSDVNDSTALGMSGLPFTPTSYTATGICQCGVNASGYTIIARAEATGVLYFTYAELDQTEVPQHVPYGSFIFSLNYRAVP